MLFLFWEPKPTAQITLILRAHHALPYWLHRPNPAVNAVFFSDLRRPWRERGRLNSPPPLHGKCATRSWSEENGGRTWEKHWKGLSVLEGKGGDDWVGSHTSPNVRPLEKPISKFFGPWNLCPTTCNYHFCHHKLILSPFCFLILGFKVFRRFPPKKEELWGSIGGERFQNPN